MDKYLLTRAKRRNPVRFDDGVAYITIISRGAEHEVLVDEEDYHDIAPHRWCLNRHGYAYAAARNLNGERVVVRLHRHLFDAGPGLDVDHINRVRLDNRRENLRSATRKQNLENVTLRKGGTSKYRGVSWNKKDQKWRANVSHHGKNHAKDCGSEEAANEWAIAKRAELYTHHEEEA